MTKEFEYLMYLFSCGARRLKADNPAEDLSWDKILTLAKEQSVLYVVIYALLLMEHCTLDAPAKEALVHKFKNDIIYNAKNTVNILQLLKRLDGIGVRPILLKGYYISLLYALPESRISSDADIYIDPKDEKKALRFLKENGFTITPRNAKSHHTLCAHPQLGLLELHIKLYDEMVDELWFEGKSGAGFEAYQRVETDEGSFYTLGKTDHLIFLALHMVKHFIKSGMSLRLMMDFVLFFNRYKEAVDIDRFISIMDKLNYLHFLDALFALSKRYLSVDTGIRLTDEPTGTANLLNDLEAGGWLGHKDTARTEAWYEYNRLKYLQHKGEKGYKFYMFKRNLSLCAHLIFLPYEQMRVKYPSLNKRRILLPAAWLHRLFTRGVTLALKNRFLSFTVDGAGDINAVANSRVALLKELKML